MILRLVRCPHAGQKDMVCHTPEGTFELAIGESKEMGDAAGKALLTRWPGCFSVVLADLTNKVMQAQSPEEVAAEEAERVVKGYQTKKV